MLRFTIVLWLSLLPAVATAQDELHVRWSDRWARVDPASYVAQAVAFSTGLIFDSLYNPGSESQLTGPALFDVVFRNELRAGTEDDRERAAVVSDALLVGLLVWPAIDSLVVAGLGRQSSDVSWQLTVMTAEVVAADFLVSTFIKALVRRARPHGLLCTPEDRETRPERCGPRRRDRSFYSGHASAAFASAGVVCMAHAHVPLYGDVGADAFACGGAILTASIVGVLRMIADRHWATDVIVGSIVGLATGLLLPYALHFGWDRSGEETSAATGPLVAPATLSYGLAF